MRHGIVFIIKLYQHFLAGFNFRVCRFYPSCSQYWIDVLEKYGFLKGVAKGVWRLLRCNPFFLGGFDPA